MCPVCGIFYGSSSKIIQMGLAVGFPNSIFEYKLQRGKLVHYSVPNISWLICCSVLLSCPTLCNLMDCSMLAFPVLHDLLEFAQTHMPSVGDAIQPSHSLPPPSPPALNLSQHQGLFQCVGSSHQVAKVLELQP